MSWRTIRGRRVNVSSSRNRRKRGHQAQRERDDRRWLFGTSKSHAEQLREEREKARKREEKAELKAIRRESKARAKAIREVGKERAKDERIRILRASENRETTVED